VNATAGGATQCPRLQTQGTSLLLTKFNEQLDRASYDVLAGEPRGHLGASAIGGKCARKIWYQFRWYKEEAFSGRLLRLFNRGHEEEFRIVRWLRAMGLEVRDYKQRLYWHEESDTYVQYDWDFVPNEVEHLKDVHSDPMHINRATQRGEGPAQWNFRDGHFSGSADGVVHGVDKFVPQLKGRGPGLLECKTSNDRAFNDLNLNGVYKSKFEHFVQMQVYMRKLGLQWALYVCVNKNDDAIYVELVAADAPTADRFEDRAQQIIAQREPPARMSDDATWWQCKFCAYKGICHGGETPEPHCRNCAMAEATESGHWICHKYNATIEGEDMAKRGLVCEAWEEIK